MFDREPEHCPIGVNQAGDGPVDKNDPEYVRTVCWCSEPNCEKWRETEETPRSTET